MSSIWWSPQKGTETILNVPSYCTVNLCRIHRRLVLRHCIQLIQTWSYPWLVIQCVLFDGIISNCNNQTDSETSQMFTLFCCVSGVGGGWGVAGVGGGSGVGWGVGGSGVGWGVGGSGGGWGVGGSGGGWGVGVVGVGGWWVVVGVGWVGVGRVGVG